MIEMDLDYVRSVLRYDPETGDLIRIKINCHPHLVGKLATQLHRSGYLRVRMQTRAFTAHRVCWAMCYGEWPEKQVDHINGDRTDNRICNLRLADNSENQQNRPSKSWGITGLRGVTVKKGRFISRIKVDGKFTHIGTFDTAEQAHAAYLAAKPKFHKFAPVVRAEREVRNVD